MSNLGTLVLALAVLAVAVLAGFLGANAASQPFAIQMGLVVAGCTVFLIFILRRAGFDSPQGE